MKQLVKKLCLIMGEIGTIEKKVPTHFINIIILKKKM